MQGSTDACFSVLTPAQRVGALSTSSAEHTLVGQCRSAFDGLSTKDCAWLLGFISSSSATITHISSDPAGDGPPVSGAYSGHKLSCNPFEAASPPCQTQSPSCRTAKGVQPQLQGRPRQAARPSPSSRLSTFSWRMAHRCVHSLCNESTTRLKASQQAIHL